MQNAGEDHHHRGRRLRPGPGLLPIDERVRRRDLRDARPARRGVHRLEAGRLHLRRLYPLADGLQPRYEPARDVEGAARRPGAALRRVGRVRARPHPRRRDLHRLHRSRPAAGGDAAPGSRPGRRPAHPLLLRGPAPDVPRGPAGHHREDGPLHPPRLSARLPPRRAGPEEMGLAQRRGLLRPPQKPGPRRGAGHPLRRPGAHARLPRRRPADDAGLHAQGLQRLPHRRLPGVRPGDRAALPGAGGPNPLRRPGGADPGRAHRGRGPGRRRRLRRGGAPGRRGDFLRRRPRHPLRYARRPVLEPRAAPHVREPPHLPLAALRVHRHRPRPAGPAGGLAVPAEEGDRARGRGAHRVHAGGAPVPLRPHHGPAGGRPPRWS